MKDDIFQEKMTSLMRRLEFVQAYIDDLLILSTKPWEDYLSKLDTVFTRLGQGQ